MPKKKRQVIDVSNFENSISEFGKRFFAESDRGLPLVVASCLDAQLEKLLREFLVADKDEVDWFFGVERPLWSFGVKTRLAYCLGLIDESLYLDLRIVQDLRNEFAHDVFTGSFDDPGVKDQCDRFKIVSEYNMESPARFKFLAAAGLLMAHLSVIIDGLASDGRAFAGNRMVKIMYADTASDSPAKKAT